MKLTKSIFVTGANGFVGKNLCSVLEKKYSVVKYKRNQPIVINEDIVIHLAGLAQDHVKVSNEEDYFGINTDFTKEVFNAFLKSESQKFIFLSSVKAVTDFYEGVLSEDVLPNPKTVYGLSKLRAEEFILSCTVPTNKKFFVLRPCLIYGPENNGNLKSLFNLVKKGIPWPFGAYQNERSFCYINNLIFILNELIIQDNILSGVYNVADDESLSTNELITLIAQSQNRKPKIWEISKKLINYVALFGDKFNLPLNSESLQKITSSFVVDNRKIISAIRKPLPNSTREGLQQTFKSFSD